MSAPIDVLVLGAGPAGSALAALTAAAGARTVLLERARFPRDKVCGEFVSAEGRGVLERLGLLPELLRAGAPAIGACRIGDRRGRALDVTLPWLARHGRDGIGISRSRLDLELARLAVRRGAELRERQEAREPILDGGRVCGVEAARVARPERTRLHATVVVAADGRRSLLARRFHPRLGDPPRSRRGSWFGLKTHFDTGGARRAPRVELHLFDGGYVGLAPVEDSRVNLCLLTTVGALRDCGGSPAVLLERRLAANPAVREALSGLRQSARWSSCGPLRFAARRAAARGALFVGDAAGTVDPFCGEGISNALVGAELALPFVLRAVERGGLDEELAAAYRRTWRRGFAPVTRRVRALGLLFARPRLAAVVLAVLRATGRSLTPRLVATTRTGLER